ncbi:cytochrome P450 734A1-like [Tasmannia lanceolata]|uniref:cytochrome P450 734A1-like n=1 Tax=Tasmannia lanceolata TaxID=3420 RepID=UPI004062C8A8
MSTCEGSPYTLLGFLFETDQSRLQSRDSHFFREYAIREINVLLWISLVTITSLLIRKVYFLLEIWAKGSKIPGPPCPSFYGHSKLFSGSGSGENLTDFLSKCHVKYGSIVRLWLGPTQLLVSVNDPTLIKEMLLKAKDKLPLTGRAFRLAFGLSSLFASSFEKVQKRRESLAIELNGKFPERANVIPLKIVDCVMERIDSIMAKGVLDCRIISQHMAFSIIGATLFGDSFLSWSSATIYEELLMLIAKDGSFWASYNVPPFWKRGFWRYQSLCKKLKGLTQDIIQQCRQNYKFSGQIDQNSQGKVKNIGRGAGIGTFSPNGTMAGSLLLEAFNDHLNPREELCGNIMGVMFHGSLTCAGLIGSILTRLVMHPEIQEKIYSEILLVCKGSSKLGANDVQKMTYLLASVYESARLLPAGPLLQRCSINHDLNLKTGVTVPAGTILVVPVQQVQMDSSIWGSDAKQFNPYRFLSKAAHQIHNVKEESDSVTRTQFTDSESSPFVLDDPNENLAFLPFGSGTRACVGQKFAILGITTLFASLLQRYEIRLQPGSQNDPKPTMNGCVLQLLPSPKIIFVRRNS